MCREVVCIRPQRGWVGLVHGGVWVLRDWAEILISQCFCSSSRIKSGIGREVETCPLFHKRFHVLPCAEQMGGTQGPHAGSGQTALVGLELSGARCLGQLSCPNSTNVDLEYFF